ncbi:MAG: hypothetical protein CMF22_10600 [Idiomarinaceae bacterium]|nr:hypothetical protein [Idiomarinaceae bacterium]MBG23890.1 hypothetical protein [Idiomarinaceae bacterium]|tara:strand:+ start:11440 stop:11802 length:363 start_codon:yes stop_codon:yes gene_type:complete
MKINILATGQSPDFYEFNGEVVTAHKDGVTEEYDFSGMPDGAKFTGADPVNGVPAIRNAERVDGTLKLTLCQQVGPGHWEESGEFDASEYDPDEIHVKMDRTKNFAGKAWALTRQGKEYA